MILFIAAVAIGLGLVEEMVALPAENHPWRVTAFVAVGGVLTGVAWLFLGSWAAPLVALLGAAAFGLVAGWDTRDNYVTPYCSYGARTQAALDACLDEINSEDIDALDTPAARFARGEITECGRASGPFCRK